MITPLEIENKEFSRSMRGYNAEEVDEFLDEIILDLQALLEERAQQKQQIESLEQALSQSRKSESSVLNTLESAKKLMNDISESAEKRAEIIIHNAQMDAESIQRDARDSIARLTEEGEKLRDKVGRFRERYRQMLEDEISQLDGSSAELFADLEREFLPASMTEAPEAPAGPEADPAEDPSEQLRTREKEALAAEPVEMSRATLVLDRSLEEQLMEQFGAKDSPALTRSQGDLTRTRVVGEEKE